MAFVHTIIRPSIDRIDRSRKRLGVALYFGGKRAGVSRMGETSALRRYCADRQRHDRNAMELSPSVLTDKLSRFPIRFRVLKRNEGIEHVEDFGADVMDRG